MFTTRCLASFPRWLDIPLSRTYAHISGGSLALSAPPCLPSSLSLLETPALLVHRPTMHANLEILREQVRDYNKGVSSPVSIRPHAKAHKSSGIAREQISILGEDCSGVCCQKSAEVMAMLSSPDPIPDVFLSNEIVLDGNKVDRIGRRLLELWDDSIDVNFSLCVDSVEMVSFLDTQFSSLGLPSSSITALIEINVGQDRCGIDTTDEMFELLDALSSTHTLSFGGVQAYHGNNQHTHSLTERTENCLQGIDHLVTSFLTPMESEGVLSDSNGDNLIVTGGGTGDYGIVMSSGVYTEIQPGSFVFMDLDYVQIEHESNVPFFEPSLFVLSTILCDRRSGNPSRTVFDVGSKAVSFDCGIPTIAPLMDNDWSQMMESLHSSHSSLLSYVRSGDEHGRIFWKEEEGNCITSNSFWKIGKKLILCPSHCDPTVNLYNEIWVVDQTESELGGLVLEVVERFDIDGRSPGL